MLDLPTMLKAMATNYHIPPKDDSQTLISLRRNSHYNPQSALAGGLTANRGTDHLLFILCNMTFPAQPAKHHSGPQGENPHGSKFRNAIYPIGSMLLQILHPTLLYSPLGITELGKCQNLLCINSGAQIRKLSKVCIWHQQKWVALCTTSDLLTQDSYSFKNVSTTVEIKKNRLRGTCHTHPNTGLQVF